MSEVGIDSRFLLKWGALEGSYEDHVLQVNVNDNVPMIVDLYYHNLTTVDDVVAASQLDPSTQLIHPGNILNIPVKCFCGDPNVNPAYGLFATYVVQPVDQITTLASNFSLSNNTIEEFNPGVNSSTLVPYSTIFLATRGRPTYLL